MKFSKIGIVLLFVIGLCFSAAGALESGQAASEDQSPARPGDIMPFGGYDWRVLDVRDNRVLLISDKIIETKAYHNGGATITWEKCTLREYLNGEFYDKFSAAEKAAIAETTIPNEDNQWFGTSGGAATADKIFLLSLEEAVRYFGDSGQLENRPKLKPSYITDQYDSARIAKNASGKALWRWLRSPGNRSDRAAIVNLDGFVYIDGSSVDNYSGGVRPALWLNF